MVYKGQRWERREERGVVFREGRGGRKEERCGRGVIYEVWWCWVGGESGLQRTEGIREVGRCL